jgi:RNA polymerase sigma factor (TIGR02999 family)
LSEITRILNSIGDGNSSAASELLPHVYDELRRLAASKMRHEKPGQTLQPTALVHEAYVRIFDSEQVSWDGRGHFFAAAAEAMRRILIDAARRRQSLKRGGDRARHSVEDGDALVESSDIDALLDLDDALTRLAKEDPDSARLVELRYFGGLTVDETAEVLGVSPRTVKRNWAFARAWLGKELTKGIEESMGELDGE